MIDAIIPIGILHLPYSKPDKAVAWFNLARNILANNLLILTALIFSNSTQADSSISDIIKSAELLGLDRPNKTLGLLKPIVDDLNSVGQQEQEVKRTSHRAGSSIVG